MRGDSRIKLVALLIALILLVVCGVGIWSGQQDPSPPATVNAKQPPANSSAPATVSNSEAESMVAAAVPVRPKPREPISDTDASSLTVRLLSPAWLPSEFLPTAFDVLHVQALRRVHVEAQGGAATLLWDADQHGGFPVRLTVQATGPFASLFQSATAEFAHGGEFDLEIPLREGPWVYGRVTNASGLPASGVEVNLMRRDPNRKSISVFSTAQAITDSQGMFVLTRSGSRDIGGPDIVGKSTLEASLQGDGVLSGAARTLVVPESGFLDAGTIVLGGDPGITVELLLDGQLYMHEFNITLGHGIDINWTGHGSGGYYRFEGVPRLEVSGAAAYYYIDVTSDPDGDGLENVVGRLIIRDLASVRGPQTLQLTDNTRHD